MRRVWRKSKKKQDHEKGEDGFFDLIHSYKFYQMSIMSFHTHTRKIILSDTCEICNLKSDYIHITTKCKKFADIT